MLGIFHTATAIAALAPQVLAQSCPTIDPQNAASFAPGYSGRVFMNGLSLPRGIIFDNKGNILTSEQGGYGVRYIQLNDNGGTDVCAQSSKQLIADSSLNHGIALSPDGNTLFASSVTTVWSWDYDGTNGTVSNRKTVIQGMGVDGYHSTRTLLVPEERPEVLLVQRGSLGNIDEPAAQIETARSQIRMFNIADIQASPVDYTSGEVLGWGLRNTVGFGEDPSGNIWSVDNAVDDMTRNDVDIHNTNPCEELNFHGPVTANSSGSLFGANYGYPECYAVWDPSVLPGDLSSSLQTGDNFVIGNPGEITDEVCQTERESPALCFPSHTAPLDIKFNEAGTAAYIAFHGSWNRQPPDGYRLTRVEFESGMPVEPRTSRDAGTNIMYNEDLSACPNGCFRPTNIVFGPNGRLFMTSDTTNEIWVIDGDF